MNDQRKEKNDLKDFKRKFKFLICFEEWNHSSKSKDSDQFNQTDQFISLVFSDDVTEYFSWERCNKINDKPSIEYVPNGSLNPIVDNFISHWVSKHSSECNYNVYKE